MRILLISLISSALLLSCRETTHKQNNAGLQKEDQYTCSMHPQIIRDSPGNCPICGMKLVKVTTAGISADKVVLNDTQMTLANIRTGVVRPGSPDETIVLTGVLTVDQRKSEVISSRAAGRIEKLFVKETGRFIRKGEPLYVLYSEALLTLQQEYVLAREQYEARGAMEKRYESFLAAAKRKLQLYGLTEKQIAALAGRKAVNPRITFVAPASGVVTGLLTSEGQYVGEGEGLYRLEDIRSLWVEAELYPGEASLVKKGDKVTVRVSGFKTAPVLATVTFISPEYKGDSQVILLRAQLANPDLRYQPGQEAQVFLTSAGGDAVALPAAAVIRTGQGSHVYVQSGRNTFEPRMVKTGAESFDSVEITEGVRAGDTVAVNGAYLLYSELVLKKGLNPMAGHVH